MNNERIGVIVPVYKTEKYIAECIESILAQTYTNFRLILVDDGTPDGAGAICDEYATKDPRITVIHQENAGVTRARARGVEEATDCEWITFVDSDDKIRNIFLEKLYLLMVKNDTDIVLCTGFSTEDSENEHITNYDFKEKLEIIQFRKLMISTRGGMPWGRMFRKRIIDEWTLNIPREIYYGEDAIMNARIAFNTEKPVYTTKSPLYFYRQATDGVCNNFISNPVYEEKLRICNYESIPNNEIHIYKDSYLYRRIFIWTTFFNNCYYTKWGNTPFHRTLVEEVKQYKLKMSWFDYQLLIHTNPIIRFIIISVRKGFNLLNRICIRK